MEITTGTFFDAFFASDCNESTATSWSPLVLHSVNVSLQTETFLNHPRQFPFVVYSLQWNKHQQ